MRIVLPPQVTRFMAALLLGATTVAGFAPVAWFFLPWVALFALVVLLETSSTPRQAALLGGAWGLGFFLAGVSWIYVSMSVFGGMAAPLAALATLVFCLYLAVFPALAAALYVAWRNTQIWQNTLLFSGLWLIQEALRGYVLTGFPWLALGYSQTAPSPLAGFAPIVGVYGVGAITAGLAAYGALVFTGMTATIRNHRYRWQRMIVPPLLVLCLGAGLRFIAWTQPTGAPITVSLLQGNVAQDVKWTESGARQAMQTYVALARTHPAPLIVLPETALPLFFDQIPPPVLHAIQSDTAGAVLLGTPYRQRPNGFVNAAVLVRAQTPAQVYAKRHLVPFGEYVPPGFSWFMRLINIPMSDFSAGPPRQALMNVNGTLFAPNICYEDIFGEELLSALPQAHVFINLSNTAWFGDSLAQPQHLQMAQMRALETGRPVLRAANTGITAALSPDGQLRAALPSFTRAALTVTVQGYSGSTPYSRWGNWLAFVLAALCLLVPCFCRLRSAPIAP